MEVVAVTVAVVYVAQNDCAAARRPGVWVALMARRQLSASQDASTAKGSSEDNKTTAEETRILRHGSWAAFVDLGASVEPEIDTGGTREIFEAVEGDCHNLYTGTKQLAL